MPQPRSIFAPCRTLVVAAVLSTVAACGGSDGTTAPPKPVTTAQVTIPAQIAVASDAGALTVHVVATYDLASGSTAALADQTVSLGSGATQNIGFTLDLAPCLNDASRAGGTTATTCSVHLTLTLLAGGNAVDAKTVGPYTLAGGQSFTANPGVSFAQVAKITVAPASGASATVTVGQPPLQLTATTLDPNGNTITGRTFQWSSSAPGVATVDSTGKVTGVTAGTATITATTGGASGTLVVTVVVPSRTVTVIPQAGNGGGTVTSAPAGINCSITNGAGSGTCNAPFAGNLGVTLTATPDGASTFAGWTGACAAAGTSATCTLPASSAAQSAGATFTQKGAVTLTLNTGGTGGGYVTSTTGVSAAIDCHRVGGVTIGATCATQFTQGTQVTLTATNDTLSTFANWTGCDSVSGNTCTITLGASGAAPVANFTASTTLRGVSTAPTGTGSGSIVISSNSLSITCTRNAIITSTSNPAAAKFAGTCIGGWATASRTATLTAQPDPGSTFAGWTGCPTAGTSGATCTLPENDPTALVYVISATFTKP